MNANRNHFTRKVLIKTLAITTLIIATAFYVTSFNSDLTAVNSHNDKLPRTEFAPDRNYPSIPRNTFQNNKIKFDEVALHLSLDNPNFTVGLNECGRLLREQLELTGDYRGAYRFLASLQARQALTLIRDWVIGTTTPEGSVKDLLNIKLLIEDLGFSEDKRLLTRLYHETGGLAFIDLARDPSATLPDTLQFSEMIRGSAKHHGVRATVDGLAKIHSDDKDIDAGIRWLLSTDPRETSQSIEDLPPGERRDGMITVLISWLRENDELSPISFWKDQLSDRSIIEAQD